MTADFPRRPARLIEPPCPGCRRQWSAPVTHCAWCHRCFDRPTSFHEHLVRDECVAVLSQFYVGDRRFHLVQVPVVGDVWELR